GGVPPAAKGTPQTYSLSKGQFLEIQQQEELTGSPIQSNKPIGVWGLMTGVTINVPPSQFTCCADTSHQQIPPIHALGHEYAAFRYHKGVEGQNESPPWRTVGAVDGTPLSYEPAAPPGAPLSLALGQIVTFNAGDPFVVRSQDANHPFHLAGYM